MSEGSSEPTKGLKIVKKRASNVQPPEPQSAVPVLPVEPADIVIPALKVGAATGALGLFGGATAGIIRTSTPVLFSLVSGAQCFVLGSTFYGARRIATEAWGGEDKLTPSDKVRASAMGGAVAGFIGGSLRGPRNILPGFLVISLLGAGGQVAINRWSSRQRTERTSWLDSKWSPVTRISDEDYGKMLEERILGFEADIALLDDRIKEIRETQSNLPAPRQNATSASANGKP